MGYEKLSDAGLKVTVQRITILDFLENTKSHPSAEIVYEAINKKFPSITLSTVYNTLEKFVEKGIIKKVFTTEGKARYDGNIDKHSHLIDNESGEIVDFSDTELNEKIENYLKEKNIPNFIISDIDIHIIGTSIK